MKKIEKILSIFGIILIILFTVLVIFFIVEFKEMLNDYRCNNLPLNEFFQDEKCERYWDFKEWEVEK